MERQHPPLITAVPRLQARGKTTAKVSGSTGHAFALFVFLSHNLDLEPKPAPCVRITC